VVVVVVVVVLQGPPASKDYRARRASPHPHNHNNLRPHKVLRKVLHPRKAVAAAAQKQ